MESFDILNYAIPYINRNFMLVTSHFVYYYFETN